MARDILGEYGPDHTSSKGSTGSSGLTTGGGKPTKHDVHNYKPPVGPHNQMQEGPGLHDANHGCCGTQGKH